MSGRINRQWRLGERPVGMIEEKHFRLVEEPVPEIKEGEVLIKNLYLSCDPTQKGWLTRDTYMPAVAVGDVVRSTAAGRVEKSNSPLYKEGDLVQGLFGWQEYAVVRGEGGPAKMHSGVPLELQMSLLGITGMTAYFGLLDIGKPQSGETVVVSAAAGATGSVAGQIARIKGCRVIGIAGGREKCEWLVKDAHFTAAIDYKSEDLGARLAELCPKGIDVYFDNVGGDILDAALANLAMRGRVVLCGAIAAYNDAEPRPGPRNYRNLMMRSGRMEGFLVFNYLARASEAATELVGWLKSGALVNRVDVVEGIENAPRALRRLFVGENQGKQLVKV